MFPLGQKVMASSTSVLCSVLQRGQTHGATAVWPENLTSLRGGAAAYLLPSQNGTAPTQKTKEAFNKCLSKALITTQNLLNCTLGYNACW